MQRKVADSKVRDLIASGELTRKAATDSIIAAS